MRRIFSELDMLIKKRKHLLSLIILLTIFSLSLFVFSHGLSRAIDGAFKLSASEEGKTPIYTFSYKTDSVTDSQSLRQRLTLNNLFSGSQDYEYYSYFETEGTITSLTEATRTALDGAGALVTNSSGDVSQNYKVPVLFIDEAAVKNIAKTDLKVAQTLMTMFEGEGADYDGIFTAVAGVNWLNEWDDEQKATGQATRAVTTTKLGSIQINVYSILPAGTTIKLGGKEYNLDSYLVIPLRDIVNSSDTDNNQDKRIFWCNIYDMRNEGVFLAQMTANELQRTVNSQLKKEGLQSVFDITITNADNDNKLLFYDNIEGIQQIIFFLSLGGLALSGFFLLLYCYFAFVKNRKYEFILLVNGTSKVELICVHALQLVVWFAVSAVAAFIIYIPIRMVTEVATVSAAYFITPLVIIFVICLALQIVCISLWDAGKMNRRI